MTNNYPCLWPRLALLLALLLPGAFRALAQTPNVGIGTSAPARTLDVTGGSIQISTAGQGLIFPDGSTQTTANRALSISGQQLTLGGAGGNTITLPTNTGAAGPAGPAGTNATVTASNGVSVASGNVTLGRTALTAATDVPPGRQQPHLLRSHRL